MTQQTTTPSAAPAQWSDPPAEDVMVEIRDLHKGFGSIRVLKGVDLTVPKGKSVVVLGGSGSGKSVLIKHTVRLLTPDKGQVWVDGRRMDILEESAVNQIRLNTGYLFQGGALFDSMTVYENLSFLLERHTELDRKEREEQIFETLNWVNLKEAAHQFPAELSGGQKKRIGLARAIILKPTLLLYDEPTTGLDPVSVRTVSELILRLRDERNITSIAITHDLLCAEIIADEVHFLYDGHILASGTLREVQQSNHSAVREFFG